MDINQPNLHQEIREVLPTPDLKVDFVRHGKPEYTEEEDRTGKYEGTLTKAGIEQANAKALELAGQIDKEKELVVFWVSPRRRAQQTADIILKVFQKQGIPVLKDLRTIGSLSDAKIGPEFLKQLEKDNAFGQWMEYWTEAKVPEDTEKPEEVKKRVERVISYLERIAGKIKPAENKKLHFICVGHEELFRDVLETAYGIGTKQGTGPVYGDSLSMEITKSRQVSGKDEDGLLNLRYDGKESRLGLNKRSRSFYKLDEGK